MLYVGYCDEEIEIEIIKEKCNSVMRQKLMFKFAAKFLEYWRVLKTF